MRAVTTRKVDRSTGSKTWAWGWYVCVELDAGQTPDAVNCLYFCHNARNLVSVGQRVESGDALAVMGSTGNAALASPPFAHCHFEVRATAAGAGLDPTAYTGHPNAVGTYGEAWNMARKLKIMENEKHPLDDLKNDEITKKREK